MSEDGEKDRKQQIREIYRYDEMSNKVLRVDKRLQTIKSDPQRDAELCQPKSMEGRISVKEMGMSARREIDNEDREQARKSLERGQARSKKTSERPVSSMRSVLDYDNSALKYYPTDQTNKALYEEILRWITEVVGMDIPHDIIASTADLLISALKDDEDEADGVLDKKRVFIEKELELPIQPARFKDLVQLVRQITDYKDGSVEEDEKAVPVLLEDAPEEGYAEEEDSTLLNELEQEDGEDEVSDSINRKKAALADDAGLGLAHDEDKIFLAGKNLDIIEEVSINEVDEFFVRRRLNESRVDLDASSVQHLSDQILEVLERNDSNSKSLEVELLNLLGAEQLQFVKYIVKNSDALLWGIRLARTEESLRPKVLQDMRQNGVRALADQYDEGTRLNSKRTAANALDSISTKEGDAKRLRASDRGPVPPLLDLESLAFNEGANLMTVSKVSLPQGSYKKVNQHYEEIHIPAPKRPDIDYPLIQTSSLPVWARNAFPARETESLNPIQSRVFPAAFHNDMNLLLCAPTGAGKTNVAMLCVLRAVSTFINPDTNSLRSKQFKIVYLAPLKALVQEQVREFRRRLAYLDIKVEELTGDSALSRHQIAETQILVSTPEKWDVITRKAADTSSYINLVNLLIIDEVHLLHDQRGPVLECIVARSLQSPVARRAPRIVGLSATLPNYQDVAKFLRVPTDGLFYFDSSFRPCPLSQQFCGITEKNSIKRLHAADEACYDKTLEAVTNGHQVIIFVHSRRETARLARHLIQKFRDQGSIESLQKADPASKQILQTEAEKIQNPHLAQTLKQGVGIHHAGLSREDRSLSEDLFADGLLQVLVSTATLAWGVNLPAHTVIIKGTDVYSAEKGRWDRLPPQDLLQMLGRAGRPRYDTHGEGIVITNQTDVQYFLAILNQQLPIESQFVSMAVDALNAEVVSGSIRSRKDAVNWLSYTYLYVRALVSPQLYNVTDSEGDDSLLRFRDSLAHSAFSVLQDEKLISYNAEEGTVQSTELGRIASYFYVKHKSMQTYNRGLNERSSQMDLFRLIAMSGEFEYLSVRPEERKELKELLERAPVPVKEDADDCLAKINILLQSYISRMKFEGFALSSDMTFIKQNAGRISRALFELSLKKGYSQTSKRLLDICKMIERRAWVANSPLRQIKDCPKELIKKTEASTLSWQDYMELESPAQVGQAVRSEKYGKMVYDLLRRFPKLILKCSIQPLTASLLRLELEILPDWIWESKFHGFGEQFLVLVEDTDGEKILYSDTILIKRNDLYETRILEITIQLSAAQQKRLPPNFFISAISERWLNCETQLVVDMQQVRLPRKFPAPTPLLDTKLVPTSEVNVEEFSEVFGFTAFNKFQSQVFHSVYNSNANVFIGAAKGTGKTVLAEIALLNHWRQNKGRAIYINPRQEKIDYLIQNWTKRFSGLAGGKDIDKLGLETTLNLRIIAQSHLILATPEQFEVVSRSWRQKKNLQNIDLLIYDDVHEMSNGLDGATYEILISRMSFISNQLDNKTRIVALASCIANGRDLGEWLGVSKGNIYNFSPQEKAAPVEIQLNSFDQPPNVAYNLSMVKSAFEFAHANATSTSIIYLPTRTSCFKVAADMAKYGVDRDWNMSKLEEHGPPHLSIHATQDPLLESPLRMRIGILYQNMTSKDRKLVLQLYSHNELSVLLVTRDCCFYAPNSKSVIILGTQYYEGKEHRYVNYTANEILEMAGTAQDKHSGGTSKALILTNKNSKDYYKKFLLESVPVESSLYFSIHDLLIAEISSSVIRSKQDCVDWLAYTYFYRRLHANPSFYGVKDVSSYGISAYLTELVEGTLTDLQNSSVIEIEDNEGLEDAGAQEVEEMIAPLTGCLVSAHYNISFLSLNMLLTSLSGGATQQDILKILSKASEFDSIPLREDEMSVVQKLNQLVPFKVDDISGANLLNSKVYLLLQAHFSRLKLTPELSFDLEVVLGKSVSLISAIVDILSGDGRLNAMTAMDISQMITQGMWDTDSPLKQIPFFSGEILAKCANKNVETVYDIMALEDEEREGIMPSDESEVFEIANFVNNYPNIELEYRIEQTGTFKAGERTTINVTLTRDEMPETLVVNSKKLPFERLESWWVVVGEVATKQLHAIKKVSLRRDVQTFDLEFTPEKGDHRLTVWCVCNSYLDADKEVSFSLNVE
ncbi:hypothetical protein HG536_0H02990 [Torulaspora globosa]|uniref:U5 small nuclear ribonucleoprotein 200 kDa helicase n=1 Tax=Torulaspora globosa TaxID=48254 RepID=A0A7G3ZN38_9SACH|nr:uncharacterized protein HG536_0H02990 [Torulaspora globosa]QLL34924.1 hypothetical protein HG536_0H02990 [Torulaspora globosa]